MRSHSDSRALARMGRIPVRHARCVVDRLAYPAQILVSLVHRALNMYMLIGLRVGLAYLYSLAAVLIPAWFPQEFREHDRAVGTYLEARRLSSP